MRISTVIILAVVSIVLWGPLAQAQNDNSTEIVFASTFVPFDSSFAVSNSPTNSFAQFPAGFKAVPKLSLDSHRTVCARQDKNNDGDVTDAGEVIRERFTHNYVGFILRNRLREALTVDYLRYDIDNVAGRTVRSGNISPVQPVAVAAGKDAKVLFLFSETRPHGQKGFIGRSRPIPRSLPNRRVLYEVFGHTDGLDKVRLREHDVIGFRDVNSCRR